MVYKGLHLSSLGGANRQTAAFNCKISNIFHHAASPHTGLLSFTTHPLSDA